MSLVPMRCISFSLRQSVVTHLRGLVHDRRGVSAVEFALILPVMLALYFGGIELSQGISVDRKVKMTARTVADLVSQVASIDNTGVDAVLGASTAVLTPFPVANAKVTVSVVAIDAKGVASVDWSRSTDGNGRSKGEGVAVPEALRTPNTSLVWGEAAYNYDPAVGYVVTGQIKLKSQIFMRPRLSESVKKT